MMITVEEAAQRLRLSAETLEIARQVGNRLDSLRDVRANAHRRLEAIFQEMRTRQFRTEGKDENVDESEETSEVTDPLVHDEVAVIADTQTGHDGASDSVSHAAAVINSPTTIALYDPADVQKQQRAVSNFAENALDGYLAKMRVPGSEQRVLAVAKSGMASACRELMSVFPNLSAAVELMAGAVALAERNQLPIRLPRLHLDGDPGCGKTELVRALAKTLELPLVVISMSALYGDFELVGCNRTYQGAEPGRLIKLLLALDVANPIFLFDEAELGTARHYGPLLSFLEDRCFTDHFFDMPFRTEFVNKVFITNQAARLTPAIRSRLYGIAVTQPSRDQMHQILQRLYTNLRQSNALFEGFPEQLAPAMIEALVSQPLRGARMVLESALYRAACRQIDCASVSASVHDLGVGCVSPTHSTAMTH